MTTPTPYVLDAWLLGRPDGTDDEPSVEDEPVDASDLELCILRHHAEPGPGYGLLVDGPWGVGKTHQVRQILEHNRIEFGYLSLAGIGSIAELNSAIALACRPGTSALVRRFDWLAQRLPGGTPGDYVKLSSDMVSALARFNVRPDRLLVLDDVERCTIDIRDLVGVLNDLIEHKDARLVLIGNVEEIQAPTAGKGFAEIREKIIGRTVRAEPAIDDALAFFVGSAETPGAAGAALREHAGILREVFVASGCRSLRVLRFAVQDAATYLTRWSEAHLSHASVVAEALYEFLPFCIAHHEEPLPDGLLAKAIATYTRLGPAVRRANPDGTSKEVSDADRRARRLYERFGGAPFTADLIGGSLLEDMIVRGRFDGGEIRARLDRRPPFARPEDVPPWRAIIFFRRLDPAVTDEAVARLRTGLAGLGYTESGEILHAAAARLFLGEVGELAESSAAIVDEACRHIDAIRRAGTLRPASPDANDPDELRDEYLGLDYLADDSYRSEFERIRAHLLKARETSLEARYASIGDQVVDTLRRDGLDRSVPVLDTIEDIRTLDVRPVLQTVDPGRFVAAWLDSPVPTWLATVAWLESRYRSEKLQRGKGMAEERDFATGVVACLHREADSRSGLDRRRVLSLVPTLPMFDSEGSARLDIEPLSVGS